MVSTKSARSISSTTDDDDRELVALGYKPSFKREFSNLATVRRELLPPKPNAHFKSRLKISFAFSIMVLYYKVSLVFLTQTLTV